MIAIGTGRPLRRMSAWPSSSVGRFARAVLAALLLAGAGGAIAAEPQPYDVLPVPSVTIFPGDVIQDAMLKEQRFLPGTRSLYPIIDARAALVGKVARRTLVPDRLIPTNAVSEPELVTRGSLTTARFNASGLTMTASVVALQSGSLGQVIQVRNVDSGRVISGVVEVDGTVRVGGQ